MALSTLQRNGCIQDWDREIKKKKKKECQKNIEAYPERAPVAKAGTI